MIETLAYYRSSNTYQVRFERSPTAPSRWSYRREGIYWAAPPVRCSTQGGVDYFFLEKILPRPIVPQRKSSCYSVSSCPGQRPKALTTGLNVLVKEIPSCVVTKIFTFSSPVIIYLLIVYSPLYFLLQCLLMYNADNLIE